MALKHVEGAIAGRRCECGRNAMFYSDAEGARCLKCSFPRAPLLSRMTREWLRQRVAEEQARRDSQCQDS